LCDHKAVLLVLLIFARCPQVFKQLFRQKYEAYALQDLRRANGMLRPPSRQQLATWCCEAWNQIPRRIIIKAFFSTKLLTPEHFRDAEADTSDSDEHIPLDDLEDFYVARDLPELLRDEVDDDLRDGIESESEVADASKGVIRKWRDFEAHLAEQELVLERERPDDVVGATIAYKWADPECWSVGEVVAKLPPREPDEDDSDGLPKDNMYDVDYNGEWYPQWLTPERYGFGPEAEPGSWVVLRDLVVQRSR
jgi:hypothetical protein